MRTRGRAGWTALSGLLALALGCGGGDGGGDEGGQGGAGGTPAPVTVTLLLTPTGVSPPTLAVRAGDRVRFVNTDTAPHQVASQACPELNAPAPLATDQDFTATMAARTTSCTFHDALNPSDTRFQGQLTFSTGGGGTGGPPPEPPIDPNPGY